MKILLLEKIKKIKNLNMLPAVVSKLLAVTSNPKSSVDDVVKIVNSDMSLAANILKIVNSPFYGFPRKITTVNDALVILGFTDIRNIALSLTVFDKLDSKGELDNNAFWKHSLGVAVAAQTLAENVNYAKPEEAFICGQLHDIGKIVLSEYFPEKFKEITNIVNSKNVFIREAEEIVLDGINHAQIGGWVCEKWKLPMLITRTVSMHHFPVIAGKVDELSAIVNAADFIIRLNEVGSAGDIKEPEISTDILDFLNLDPVRMEEIYEIAEIKINKAEEFLNLAKKMNE